MFLPKSTTSGCFYFVFWKAWQESNTGLFPFSMPFLYSTSLLAILPSGHCLTFDCPASAYLLLRLLSSLPWQIFDSHLTLRPPAWAERSDRCHFLLTPTHSLPVVIFSFSSLISFFFSSFLQGCRKFLRHNCKDILLPILLFHLYGHFVIPALVCYTYS